MQRDAETAPTASLDTYGHFLWNQAPRSVSLENMAPCFLCAPPGRGWGQPRIDSDFLQAGTPIAKAQQQQQRDGSTGFWKTGTVALWRGYFPEWIEESAEVYPTKKRLPVVTSSRALE